VDTASGHCCEGVLLRIPQESAHPAGIAGISNGDDVSSQHETSAQHGIEQLSANA
jgi:hypothetical protein